MRRFRAHFITAAKYSTARLVITAAALLLLFPLQSVAGIKQQTLENYGTLPLVFVPNHGQADSSIHFLAQGAGFRFAFMRGEALFAFSKRDQGKTTGMALALDFLGARREAFPEGRRPETGTVNYFVGNDRARWQTGLPVFEEIVYRELWPGIDLVFRGSEGQMKYEFVIRPGADVADIRLAYRGVDRLSLDGSGNLRIRTPLGVLTDAHPASYQTIGGKLVSADSRYRLSGKRGYGFKVQRYDRSRPLVIDPGLAYSTFLGGWSSDAGLGIAVDAEGNAYVTGFTNSADFPVTPGVIDPTFSGGFQDYDAFVTKLNATGTALVYSTFLGGAADDLGRAIAIDDAGNAYVTGSTDSADFPTTSDTIDPTYNGGQDAFVTKLNSAGSAILYSTFLGGRVSAPNGGTSNDGGSGIAVDSTGNAYVMGNTGSADFPTTALAYDQTQNGSIDIFVAKLNATASAFVYSTFLGTTASDLGSDIDIDSSGNAYVTGSTPSSAFPVTPGAFDPSFSGGYEDAFVTKLNPDGSALVYSTFLGGSESDRGHGIAVDAAGSAYVVGETGSAMDFPITPGAFQTTHHGVTDTFVTKLNPTGSALVYSTFLGGSSYDTGHGIAIDSMGTACVAGFTGSYDFPTTDDAFDRTYNAGGMGVDVFVSKLDAAGAALLYSTFLGGSEAEFAELHVIAVDTAGDAYVTGSTFSGDFPTTEGAFDVTHNGIPYQDAFVAKLDIGNAQVPATLTLAPGAATNRVDTSHAVIATVQDTSGQPVAGTTVRFNVTGSVIASGSCATDVSGQCTYTYGGPALPGTDLISAWVDVNENATHDEGEPSATATKSWVLPESTAGCKVTQGGQIIASNGDKATFGGEAQVTTSIKGQEQYTDHGPAARLDVHSTSLLAVVCSSSTASIFGQGTLAGSGTMAFRIDVKDLGQPGSGETYRIRFSNGYDSGEQVLAGGNVQIHKP
jgi:hypothetical protein